MHVLINPLNTQFIFFYHIFEVAIYNTKISEKIISLIQSQQVQIGLAKK